MNTSVLERSVVMVVDDHPETLQLLIDALEGASMTVLVATGGKQAIEQVRHLVPDLILMDAVMPGIDGFETCRKLKSGYAVDVPVIFMTGLEDTEHIVRGLDAGGIDYLTKPIAPDELLARMRVHLANARAARDVKAALDAGGRTMLAAGMNGNVRWATPQAQRMLALLDGGDRDDAQVALPPTVCAWLTRMAVHQAAGAENIVVTAARAPIKLRFRLLSRVNDDEWLLVIQQADPAEIERERISRLQQHFGLTLREAEVLHWLSIGKANRDIADILGMSYRTVDKHLEHVYSKIGVDSRAGAIAASGRSFGD